MSSAVKRVNREEEEEDYTAVKKVKREKEDYTIGWICPLESELTAALESLDDVHPNLPKSPRDENIYEYGSVGEHNIVLATLGGEDGLGSAALVAKSMWHSFSHIRFILVVGIGGGVPSALHDIRLGDVVISQPDATHGGVIQWDKGQILGGGHFERKSHLAPPPAMLRRLVGGTLGARIRRNKSTFTSNLEYASRTVQSHRYPVDQPDNLFDPDYVHQQPGSDCSMCDKARIISIRPEGRMPKIHRGLIASGNKVMKNGAERDRIAQALGGSLLCFEEEAAGLMTELPCLVIRGISDYSDSHKNDGWHEYAAVTAAACAKEILQILPPEEVHTMSAMKETVEATKKTVEATKDDLEAFHTEWRQGRENDERTAKERDAAKLRQRIIEWLLPSNEFYNTRKVDDGSFEPGSWFQELECVKIWLKTNQTSSIWIFGDPGVGRTVLSDQMADRISSLEGLSSPLVLRIYLEYDKRALQTVDHCLRHLLRQVISHPLAPQVSEDLRRCYEIANSSAKPPTTEELMMLLALELTPFENTWIVLDGLEEVKGSVAQNLLRHFKAMITDMSEVNLRLAVFSRTSNEDKDVYGSEKVFCNSTKDHRTDPLSMYWACKKGHEAKICHDCYNEGFRCTNLTDGEHSMFFTTSQEVATPSSIIMAFVEHELDRSAQNYAYGRRTWTNLLREYPKLKETVPKAITERANGSFLVARHCVDFLKEANSYKEVKITLEKLPRSIKGVYELLFQRIECLSEDDRLMAQKALTHVTIAERPLSVSELREALSLQHDHADGFLDADRRPFADSIVAATQGLIGFQSGKGSSESIFTMHLTLREFLLSQGPNHWFQRHRADVAKNLIQFMNIPSLAEPCTGAALTKRFAEHPYFLYAAMHWADHVHPFQNEPDVIELLVEFLNDQGKVASWLQATSQSVAVEFQDLFVRENALAVHICAGYGFSSVLPRLTNFYRDLDVGDPFFHRPPLVYACRQFKTETALQLIEAGASANTEDDEGWTALIAAVMMNDPEVVNALLTKRPSVDVNKKLPSESQRPPLILAVQVRREAVVSDDPRAIAYYEECVRENVQIFRLLLKHPKIDVNLPDSNGQTALHLALVQGEEDLVDALLDHRNIDLNLPDSEGQSPLMRAGEKGRLSLAAKLLERGAAPEQSPQSDHFLKSTVDAGQAVDVGHADIVEATIESSKDGDLLKQDSLGRVLLHSACVNGLPKIVELLLTKGSVDINVQGDKGETAMHETCRGGSLEVAKLLLSFDAKLDVRDNFGRLALDVARQYGKGPLVDLLSKSDPNNSQDKGVSLPTWSMAGLGDLEGLQELRQRGEDLFRTDPDSSDSPLHWAIHGSHVDILKFLLDADLAVDYQDSHGNTACHWAADFDEEECITLLKQKGCNLNIVNNWNQTPLIRAIRMESYAAIIALVLAGSELSDLDQALKQEVLFTAVDLNNPEAVRIVCENGANPWTLDGRRYSARVAAKIYGFEEVFQALEKFPDPSRFSVRERKTPDGPTGRNLGILGRWFGISSYLSSKFAGRVS